MKTIKLTVKELELLNEIKFDQNEEGHSDFTNEDVITKSRAGVLANLIKKDLIYNSYENFTDEDGIKMWCLTYKGADIVGTPNSWK